MELGDTTQLFDDQYNAIIASHQTTAALKQHLLTSHPNRNNVFQEVQQYYTNPSNPQTQQ